MASSSHDAISSGRSEDATVSVGSPPNSPVLANYPSSIVGASVNNKQKCFHVDIVLPDGSLRQVEVDFKANGQECLDKICNSLGIVEEVDYFGLTYYGPKQEELWVNMRNRLFKQLSTGQPVPRMQLRLIDHGNWLPLDDWRHAAAAAAAIEEPPTPASSSSTGLAISSGNTSLTLDLLIALLAQAEFGDFDSRRTPIKYQKYWREQGDIPAEVIAATAEAHRRLSGLSPASAEYRLLQLAASLPMYGSHYHEVKDCFETKLNIAKVTISDRVLYLSLSQENGSVKEVGYRLVSQKAANGLYRCVTETHSFFRCDTVRTDVSAQTCRDIKGALVSFFTEHDNSMVRDFVFDIQRTAKEVHDDARRRLYRCNSAANSPTSSGAFSFDESSMTPPPQASRLCRICIDSGIGIVFIPCGHMLACRDCSERLADCPLCRRSIEIRQPFFAPWNA
uniref:RING-type domain-containing protein n=1 Tax=Macrostomum lignano TaxID=282301 RepID=A0A1I8I0Y0_9PLAT